MGPPGIDLRGDSGGSSVWGDQIAEAVFGSGWVRQANAWLEDGVYTEWRVSPRDLDALRGLLRQQQERHSLESPRAAATRRFLDSMTVALSRGDSLYGTRAVGQGARRPEPQPTPGRVVLVTSPSCFSACLGVLDRMRLHPAVVQVGQITGVNTAYMENWGALLPSGLSQIGYPMNVYRNRRRRHNQPYEPHVRFPGDLRDSAALRTWILQQHRDEK